ncbi:hypothetical protein ACTFIV_010188 [Dictyostelium citrinum]
MSTNNNSIAEGEEETKATITNETNTDNNDNKNNNENTTTTTTSPTTTNNNNDNNSDKNNNINNNNINNNNSNNSNINNNNNNSGNNNSQVTEEQQVTLEDSGSEDDINFEEHELSDSADEDDEDEMEEDEEDTDGKPNQNSNSTGKRRGRPSNQSKVQQLMQSTNTHLSQITPDSPITFTPDGKVPKRNPANNTPNTQSASKTNKRPRLTSDEEKELIESDESDGGIGEDDDSIMSTNDKQQDGNQSNQNQNQNQNNNNPTNNNNSNNNNNNNNSNNNNQILNQNNNRPARGRPKANGSRSEERKRIQLQQYIQATQGSSATSSDQNNQNNQNNSLGEDEFGEDFEEEEEDMGQPKKKTKYKTSKKSVPNHLDIRPCWFVGCVKADRSLKILRPCLIPTCKTHAIKSEMRIAEALRRGDFVSDESSGGKDKVCGICGDKKDLHHCGNNGCAFGFCNDCVEIAAMKHNNHPNGSKWVCWVCQFVRTKAKEKERTRWVKEQLNPGLTSISRKFRRGPEHDGQTQFPQQSSPNEKRQQQPFNQNNTNNNINNQNNNQNSGFDPSGSPNNQQNQKRLRKKINASSDIYETRKYTKKRNDEDSAPPSPTSIGGSNSMMVGGAGGVNKNTVVEQQGYSATPPSPNTLMAQQQQQLQQTHQQARLSQQQAQLQQLKALQQQQQQHNNGGNSTFNNNNNNLIESVLSPNREPLNPIDNFVDQTFTAVKFFSSLSQNPPDEIKERIDNFVDLMMRIKTVRWASDYGLVWRMIEELSNLIKRNLLSSQSVVEMYSELKSLEEGALENMTTNARNVPLERAITMVFENHETAGLIGKECCSTRNALIYSIEVALRAIADYQHDLEDNLMEESLRSNKVSTEIEQIEHQIKANLDEIHKFKYQEVELLDSLSKVRGAIAAHESIRDTLQKKSSELKVDMLLIKNGISDKEKETKSQQATLENEIYALKLLITMVESIYWIHDYFYESRVGECEKLINNKLSQLQNKLESQIPHPPNALDNAIPNTTTTVMGEDGQPVIVPTIDMKNKFKTIAIYHKICMQHKVPNFHLEKPDRIQVTVGCINEYARHPLVDIFDNPPEVDMRYVMAVHDANYIKKLETSLPPENSEFETHLESDKSGAMVTVASHKDFEGDDDNIYDTFVSHRSIKAALRASGSVCAAVDSVSRSGYTRAFCAIRPPGHHAGRYGRTSDAPSQGYCLINNVAIGAKYASLTAGYSRIAVVDFDVHHGNGTQEILSGDDNFLFISIHVCDEKRYFYPGTGQDVGDIDEVSGQFEGNILNIGLKRNTGSAVFLQQWMNKIIPRLEAYKPQLIFLSAGFDGHKDDPTNGLKLNEEDYFVITKMIKTVAFKYCKGRIISVLEGGYGIEKSNSLQRCVNSHLKALIEDTDEEIHLANISYGHFSETQETAIPKFNINNFISNPNKRGKKNNLNTINFINNNMNNINNNITNSLSNKQLERQKQLQQLQQQQQAQQALQQQTPQQQQSQTSESISITTTTTTTTTSSMSDSETNNSNNNNSNNNNSNNNNNPNNNPNNNSNQPPTNFNSSTTSPILSGSVVNINTSNPTNQQSSVIISDNMDDVQTDSIQNQQFPLSPNSVNRGNNPSPSNISMSGAQRSAPLVISQKPSNSPNSPSISNNNNGVPQNINNSDN